MTPIKELSMSYSRLLVLSASLVAGGCAVLVGCERRASTASSGNPAGALPGGLFLASTPAGAKPVEEIKGAAKAGDTVAIRGRIGGSEEPFVEGRAVFTVMGPGLPYCSAGSPMPDCKTPWDYCCENPGDIAEHMATVQVVDAAGAPLRRGLRGQNGLKELSEVIVVGKVSQAEGKVLVVNATGIYRVN
jgi:hypothetical protein